MSRRWLLGVWALLGAPAAVLLVGYFEQALYVNRPNSLAFLYIGALVPGVCIGLGLLALLSLVQSGWLQRVIVAAAYGSIMYIVAAIFANPVLTTHAVLMEMPK